MSILNIQNRSKTKSGIKDKVTYSSKSMIEKKNILGVNIANATKEEILEYIITSLEIFKKKLFFVTPNPEFLVLANKNPNFKNILNRAELASADGIGVLLASKILSRSLKGRFTGVELLESLCKRVAEKPITVGFLGGGPGVAEKTAECLQKKYPGLKVAFAKESWPKGHFGRLPHVADDARLQNFGNQSANPVSLSKIRLQSGTKPNFNSSASGQAPSINNIDILFVAFGAPKQEFWISENLQNLPVKIAIGVGGAFDYISGKVERAPGFIQNIGFEWLYRLLHEPWRIKRQLSLLKFIWLVFKEKLKDPNKI